MLQAVLLFNGRYYDSTTNKNYLMLSYKVSSKGSIPVDCLYGLNNMVFLS